MDGALFIDTLILIIGIIALVKVTISWQARRWRWYQYLPVWIWALHLSTFYGLDVFHKIGVLPVALVAGRALHEWSVVLRLHDIITIACLAYIMHQRNRLYG